MISILPRFVSAALVGSIFLFSGSRPCFAVAGIVSLNGEWEVAAGVADRIPVAFPHRVPVPGYLDMATPVIHGVGYTDELARLLDVSKPEAEWFWYRRTFELDIENGSTVRLVLHKAAYGSEVWLNGQRVGGHAPNFTPGWFDVTDAVRRGANELLVRVGAHPGCSSGVSGMEPERRKLLPGIWDDVELHVSGPVTVEALQIVPRLATASVEVFGEVGKRDGAEDIEGFCLVRRVDTGEVLAKKAVALDSTPSGKVRLRLLIALGSFTPWTPSNPFLYELELSFPGLVHTERFGMRSFEGVQGEGPGEGRFRLNGQTIYLRGTNVCFGRWTEDPARGALPWDEAWVRRLFRKWKDLNYNSFRCTISPLPRLWYRIADEEGLLIQDEYAIWQRDLQRISVQQLAEEYRQWIKARWNHPSVVIFDAQNETLHRQNGAITGEALELVRGEDRSGRPWDNGWMYPQRPGDASERHPYLLSQSPPEGLGVLHGIESSAERTGEFSKGVYVSPAGKIIPGGLNPLMAHEGYERVMDWSRHPMIVNEFEWLWLSRAGRAIPELQFETYLGVNSTEAQRRLFRARMTAAVTELWRTARTSAAVMNFEGLSFPGEVEGRADILYNTSDAWLDVENLRMDPAFEEAVRDANAPTGLMLKFFHRELPVGSELDLPVLLVNDRVVPVSGTVNVELASGDGAVSLETGPKAFELDALGAGELAFAVDGPSKPGRWELTASMRLESGEVVRSRRDFHAFSGETLSIRLTGEDLGPVDNDLFGHFMELVQFDERGPEQVAESDSGLMPWPVERAIRSLGPTVLRYPGGYLVELPEFSWTHLIDGAFDREDPKRPVITDKQGREHSHRFGLHEFMALAGRLDAEPLITVKLTDVARGFAPADEIVEQAASMVAYCNAPAEGDLSPELQRWADLRARNGRTEPWNVRRWQLGNEFVWVGVGPLRKRGMDAEAIGDAYVDALDRVSAAMLAVDPTIELVFEAQMEQQSVGIPVVAKVAEQLGDRFQWASAHRYHSWAIDKLEVGGEPVRADSVSQLDHWFAAVSAPASVNAAGQVVFREYPFEVAVAHGFRPALTEWNWNSWWALDASVNPGVPPRESLWTKGVAAASILHSILRSPQPIGMATQSMLVGSHWELRSIDVSGPVVLRHPSGMVTGLYRRCHGNRRLEWAPVGDWPTYDQPLRMGNLQPAEGVALVDCVVTATSDTLFVHLINRSPERRFNLRFMAGLEKAIATEAGSLFRLECAPDENAARQRWQEIGRESRWPVAAVPGGWEIPIPPATVQVAVLPRGSVD